MMDSKPIHLTMFQQVKRSRKVMTLEKKVNVLDRLECGESAVSIARELRVNESTIRTIKRSGAAIRASVARGYSKNSRVRYVQRDRNLERMEVALNVWINEQVQNSVPLVTQMICAMARQFYKLYVEKYGRDDKDNPNLKEMNFKASKGWFENFKKRYSLQDLKFFGGESPFVNKETVEVLEHLQSVIKDECFDLKGEDDSGHNVRRCFMRILEELEKDPQLPLPPYWKNWNIYECIGEIRDSLEEMQPTTLSACWRTACATAEVRRMVQSMGDEEEVISDIKSENIVVVPELCMPEGCNVKDERTGKIEQVLIKKELEEVPHEEEAHVEEVQEEDFHEEDGKVNLRVESAVPALHDLNKGMMMAFNVAEYFQGIDPDAERSGAFKRGLATLLEPYKEMWQGYFDSMKS